MTHSPLAQSRRGAALGGRVPLLLPAALAALAACSGGGGGGSGAAGGGGGGGEGGAGGGPVIEEPNRFRLRIDDAEVPSVVLELDKQKALQVFGEDGAKQITILNVDTTGLLQDALQQIQNACGTSWQNDSESPGHNCALTPLGQSFGAAWRTSPEFALVRLLSMTPANADVTGTSLEGLYTFFDDNPGTFAFDFADVLADSITLDLTVQPEPTATRSNRTAPLVPMDKLISALQQQLLGTHPAIPAADGVRLPVTLYEALFDLQPLSEKLGPSGDHPGVLVPDDDAFTTRSDVLQPDFLMRVVAESGLRRVSGVDLSRGGGDMFVRVGDAPLRFDFNDPEKLQITGIAQAPIVDMRIALRELPDAIRSCTGTPDCKTNSPDSPVGTDSVWSVPPYLLESIVATAGYLTYGTRVPFSGCYFRASGACQLGVNIGQEGEPLGWSVFLGNIVFPPNPPPDIPEPQFFWELLTDVAQVAIHDPTGDGAPEIAEGAAQPVYALHGVSIGLTGEQILADLRPTLQSQAKEIAEIILGRYWVNNDALDFFYDRGAPGGAPTLFFVAEGDLRPPDQSAEAPRAYTYERPGFFTSPDLDEASKVSKKELEGLADTAHEKYRLPPGETTLYTQDDEGAVYEVRFHVPDSDDPVEITADVERL
ncbi:hypothetical protein WME75_43145 [Sorangium sp. So ce1014]|uniref:hypothetical protein n=1 Tax=Sorangium sp. So ce1014 TaxID=3133326 RepID=UPI003F602736